MISTASRTRCLPTCRFQGIFNNEDIMPCVRAATGGDEAGVSTTTTRYS
jgi:hypothetical protein